MPHATRSGDVLGDRYLLGDLLTESGSGRFWRAHDRILERHVAIHVIARRRPARVLAHGGRPTGVDRARPAHPARARRRGERRRLLRRQRVGLGLVLRHRGGPHDPRPAPRGLGGRRGGRLDRRGPCHGRAARPPGPGERAHRPCRPDPADRPRRRRRPARQDRQPGCQRRQRPGRPALLPAHRALGRTLGVLRAPRAARARRGAAAAAGARRGPAAARPAVRRRPAPPHAAALGRPRRHPHRPRHRRPTSTSTSATPPASRRRCSATSRRCRAAAS